MRRIFQMILVVAALAFVVSHYGSSLKQLIRQMTAPALNNNAQEQEAVGADVFHGCPMEGSAKSLGVQALNRLKNRYHAPTEAQINPRITLEAILQPGNDSGRWKVQQGAIITGYVWDIKPGGVETCNCQARDRDLRDTHIELVLDPMTGSAPKRMIVEVTPRWREILKRNGMNWSTDSLRTQLLGRWVNVRGWMLFDKEHMAESENTAPGRERNWRATAWEIHPVNSLEVVNRPR